VQFFGSLPLCSFSGLAPYASFSGLAAYASFSGLISYAVFRAWPRMQFFGPGLVCSFSGWIPCAVFRAEARVQFFGQGLVCCLSGLVSCAVFRLASHFSACARNATRGESSTKATYLMHNTARALTPVRNRHAGSHHPANRHYRFAGLPPAAGFIRRQTGTAPVCRFAGHLGVCAGSRTGDHAGS